MRSWITSSFVRAGSSSFQPHFGQKGRASDTSAAAMATLRSRMTALLTPGSGHGEQSFTLVKAHRSFPQCWHWTGSSFESLTLLFYPAISEAISGRSGPDRVACACRLRRPSSRGARSAARAP